AVAERQRVALMVQEESFKAFHKLINFWLRAAIVFQGPSVAFGPLHKQQQRQQLDAAALLCPSRQHPQSQGTRCPMRTTPHHMATMCHRPPTPTPRRISDTLGLLLPTATTATLHRTATTPTLRRAALMATL